LYLLFSTEGTAGIPYFLVEASVRGHHIGKRSIFSLFSKGCTCTEEVAKLYDGLSLLSFSPRVERGDSLC